MNILKAMKKPPEPVRLVMESVCIMLSVKPARLPDPKDNTRRIITYWPPSVKLLNKSDFRKTLIALNINKVADKVFDKIRTEYI